MCQLGVESLVMSEMNRRPVSLILLGLVLLAAWLRWRGLFANTFHADEALFSSWARLIAVGRDPLLHSQVVDKPPLLLYAQALFFPLFGPVDWAARIPNLVAGMLLIPLTGRLAWLLYGQPVVTILSATIVAVSPLAVQFSPTGFTDPLLTCLIVAALAATVSGQRSGQSAIWAGLFFGLAAATKYQAWLFLPLLMALAGLRRWQFAAWLRFLAGLLPVLLFLLLWELARTGRPALWSNQLNSFGGLRLAWSWELWPRLMAWSRQWHYLLARPLVGLLFLFLVPLFWLKKSSWSAGVPDRSAEIDRLLILYLLVYALVHWLLAIPVWDRYLLPVLPLVALLSARILAWLAAGFWPVVKSVRPSQRNLLAWALGLLLLTIWVGPAVQARNGEFPVGGRPSADGGAAEVAVWLSDAPYGTVLYDHWYSWHWRYYFFDQVVYPSWFSHPSALVEDLRVFASGPEIRYLALPTQPEAQVVTRTLRAAGIDLSLVMSTTTMDGRPTMDLYRLTARQKPEGSDEGG